ncbi:MAG: putative metal-binding motif-containing protein, partial [Alphaproteobacteria bacterium]|nr:putative metal-binding motif-containing protein [Alphaproteobacteria bacterium]
MRRNALPPYVVGSVVATAALSVAYAASTTITSNADFNKSDLEDNVSVNSNQLSVTTLDNTYGDWYRRDYDGVDWGLELQKSATSGIWATDVCLPTTSFPIDTLVGGVTYRTGTLNGSHLLLDNVDLPINDTEITEIRFLTHGARTADTVNVTAPQADYTVTVGRVSGGDVTFTIPIASAADSNRTASGAGSAAGSSWSTTAWNALTAENTDECRGNFGNEVVLTMPGGSVVDNIHVDYQASDETTDDDTVAGESWLGGPFALVTDAIQSDIEADFTWRATYQSSTQVSQAINAGGNVVWHRVSWNTSNLTGTGSDVFLRVRCGDNSGGGNSLLNNELKGSDAQGINTWYPDVSGPGIPMNGASSVNIPTCTGQYIQYELEFYPEFDVSPIIQDITFTYNPDLDGDGEVAETGLAGFTVDCDDSDPDLNHADADSDGFNTCQTTNPDCDDTDPLIKPGAAVSGSDVADGIDRNCDGREECYRDQDNDNYTSTTVQAENGSPNMLCDG